MHGCKGNTLGNMRKALSKEVALFCEPGQEPRGKQAAETTCAKSLRLEAKQPMSQGGQRERKGQRARQGARYVRGLSKS